MDIIPAIIAYVFVLSVKKTSVNTANKVCGFLLSKGLKIKNVKNLSNPKRSIHGKKINLWAILVFAVLIDN
jgi:hypothetical protein